jgi:hypothetical protein
MIPRSACEIDSKRGESGIIAEDSVHKVGDTAMSTAFPWNDAQLASLVGTSISPTSLVVQDSVAFWPVEQSGSISLQLVAPQQHAVLRAFAGQQEAFRDGYVLLRADATHSNAKALRDALPWLKPVPLGLQTSAGFGDRLGCATPGHVRALQQVLAKAPNAGIVPIFAQQSIREMERTRRSPDDVMSDATWGTFAAGWRGVVGADADHLKTPADIDACVAAGFSFFTIDPGAYVDSAADEDSSATIREKLSQLPWDELESSEAQLLAMAGQSIDLGDRQLSLDEAGLLRAAVKYGKAVAHVARMYRHLASKGIPFDLEVSVDETETPTTHLEHVYVASELKRLGVQWVSLAPRYVGHFEKGIDYIGDLDALRSDLAGHAAIAKALGPYKLSLHSGSDKFSVYPLIAEATGGLVHLKTAGTSYLEALRVFSQHDVALFRDILSLGRERYPVDRATYHVSAELDRVPASADLSDAQLPDLLEQIDARQVLHVTFGSALAEFGPAIHQALRHHSAAYSQALERHFYRHLAPFAALSD